MIHTLTMASIIIFWILFMGRTIMLAHQGVKVFVIAKGKQLVEKTVEIMLVPLLVLWSIQIVFTSLNKPLFNFPFLWSSPVLQWVGLVLCVIGLSIFVGALISFGNAWRVGIDEQNSNRLVTAGLFAFSRNPIFLFMNIYFCGIFLIYPTIFFLLFFICFAAGIHLQILNEERFLRAKFGVPYMEYCKRVRRYI